MKGLLVKDVLLTRKMQGKTFACLMLFALVMAFTTDNPFFAVSYITFICSIFTAVSYTHLFLTKLKSLVSKKKHVKLLLQVSRCSVNFLMKLRLVITLVHYFVVFREQKSKEDRFLLNQVV